MICIVFIWGDKSMSHKFISPFSNGIWVLFWCHEGAMLTTFDRNFQTRTKTCVVVFLWAHFYNGYTVLLDKKQVISKFLDNVHDSNEWILNFLNLFIPSMWSYLELFFIGQYLLNYFTFWNIAHSLKVSKFWNSVNILIHVFLLGSQL